MITHNADGVEYVKLGEVSAGDTIYADSGFDCMEAGAHTVLAAADGELYVECQKGQHWLSGQVEDESDHVIGFTRVIA